MGGFFDLDGKVKRENEINSIMSENGFWDDKKRADSITKELSNIKKTISSLSFLTTSIDGNYKLSLEIDDDIEMKSLLEEELFSLKRKVDELSLEAYLNDEYDYGNAIIEIHAGAGGTESCDWVSMLYRMYSRYCQNKGYSLSILDKQDGEEAGLKSIMFQVNGINAYGYLKREKGIHRLVRISPFDANKRRHTSFAAVDVTPEINDKIDIVIKDSDIRIDIYRSSGPGGQGVNTTDSAVRVTHIPTGIVVTCQNERSQIRNKEKALEVLKGKLYLLEKEKHEEKISGIKGELLSNGFGSSKRSYVLCPYTLVKDYEFGYETSNVSAVLDGEIEEMLEFGIKNGK